MALGKNKALSGNDLIVPIEPVIKSQSNKVIKSQSHKEVKSQDNKDIKPQSGKDIKLQNGKVIKSLNKKGNIQISFWLPPDLIKQLKLKALNENTFTSEITEKALEKYLT